MDGFRTGVEGDGAPGAGKDLVAPHCDEQAGS